MDVSRPEACAKIASFGRTAASLEDHAALAERVLAEANPGDVIVVLSNGAFGGIVPRLVEGLAR